MEERASAQLCLGGRRGEGGSRLASAFWRMLVEVRISPHRWVCLMAAGPLPLLTLHQVLPSLAARTPGTDLCT